MNFDLLLAILLEATLCGLIAFLASLLLGMRLPILSLLGAGLLGRALGAWLGTAVKGSDWPGLVTVGGATVHLLWTFVGALIVLLVVRLLRGRRA